MTSLLTGPRPASGSRPNPSDDFGNRRPLALIACLGGIAAALAPLIVCLALGVIGWFVSDAGAHGVPRDGLRVGATGWLMAHGSGVHVLGVPLAVVPLGLTLVCAWTIWRIGQRVGESVSGHGPDADAIADGERDWTVPVATALFGAGYLIVAVVTLVLASTPSSAPSVSGVVVWSISLTVLFAGPAIAIGSGRAAIWAAAVPSAAKAALATAARTLLLYLAASAVVLAVALARDFGAAANVLSALHADAGDAALFTVVTAALTPNAIVFSGAYLLGPGFSVGVGTLVSPTVVSLGPVPAFPLLAALPANGPAASWVVGLMAVPFLVAAIAAARTHRHFPTTRWEEGALRGLTGGVIAGLAFGVLAAVAGGAVGPGRMQDVSPFVFDVLVHAIAAFGIGGLLGGTVMTWWDRRKARATRLPEPVAELAAGPGPTAPGASLDAGDHNA